MTIAIGLKHSEGILLCADTLVAIPGYYKEGRSKLRTLVTKSCRLYLAIAGDVEFTNRALEVIRHNLDLAAPDPLHIKNALDLACFEIHDKWHDRVIHPLQMIGVIAVRGFPPELIKIDDTIVSPIANVACIGTGESLAKFLLKTIHTPTLSKQAAVRYAAYVLFNVKGHAEGCGGVSEFLDVNESGGWHFPLQDRWVFEILPEMETTFADLDRQVRSIVGDFVSEVSGFDAKVHDVAEHIAKTHKAYHDKVGAREIAYLEQKDGNHA